MDYRIEEIESASTEAKTLRAAWMKGSNPQITPIAQIRTRTRKS
jgi:hypothetical protein